VLHNLNGPATYEALAKASMPAI